MRLEEFRQIQGSMISQTQFYLTHTWTNNIQNIIEKSFSNVGKGWFNMNETSKETYEFGKLRKYLTVVKLIMQDTLYYLARKSLANYRDIIKQ
jgi:dynein heavy chain